MVKIVVQYKDREVVITGALLASTEWYKQIQSRTELDIVLPDEQRRRFISLRGMLGIVFEYETGDSEYESKVCGIKLSPAQQKAARDAQVATQSSGSYRLYSDWHP